MNPLENFSANQAEEFWHLLTLHRLAKIGYVAFAMYASGKDWDALKTALEAEPTLNTKIIYVPSGNISISDPNFLPSLRAIGLERSLVLMRVDLSPTDEAFKHFCGYLNFHREEIVDLPHGLIICVTEAVLTQISLKAPDTFAVKRALLDFRGEHELDLPLGDSGLWLRDIQAKPEEVQKIRDLLKAEKQSANPDQSYIIRLKLRLANSHYDAQGFREAEELTLDLIKELQNTENAELEIRAWIAYANSLDGLGRKHEALKIYLDYVPQIKKLVQQEEEKYLLLLCVTLSLIGNIYFEFRNLDESIRYTQEAILRIERSTLKSNTLYQLNIAKFKTNLSNDFAALGNYSGAVSEAVQAVKIFRELADKEPIYLDYLEQALNCLSNHYLVLGKIADSLQLSIEAVSIVRKLVGIHAKIYEPRLATSLINLSGKYAELKDFENAIDAATEAASILEKPLQNLENYALSLNNLAVLYQKIGHIEKGLGFMRASISIYKELLQQDSRKYLPEMARSLSNLSDFLSKTYNKTEAIEAAEHSRKVYEILAKENPKGYLPVLARVLGNLAVYYGDIGQREKALNLSEESVEKYRNLVKDDPEVHSVELAHSLMNLAAEYFEKGSNKKAIKFTEESSEILRRSLAKNPVGLLPDLAIVLNNLGLYYSKLENKEKAFFAFYESLEIIKPFFKQYPTAFYKDAGRTLKNYLHLTKQLNQQPDYEILKGFEPLLEQIKKEESAA